MNKRPENQNGGAFGNTLKHLLHFMYRWIQAFEGLVYTRQILVSHAKHNHHTNTSARNTSTLNYDKTISLHLLSPARRCRVPWQQAWSPGNPALPGSRCRDLAWNHAGIKLKSFYKMKNITDSVSGPVRGPRPGHVVRWSLSWQRLSPWRHPRHRR